MNRCDATPSLYATLIHMVKRGNLTQMARSFNSRRRAGPVCRYRAPKARTGAGVQGSASGGGLKMGAHVMPKAAPTTSTDIRTGTGTGTTGTGTGTIGVGVGADVGGDIADTGAGDGMPPIRVDGKRARSN